MNIQIKLVIWRTGK